MKKWYLIIIGIIAIAAIVGIIKILSYTSKLEKSLSSEHSLNEQNLIILKESFSRNFYKYSLNLLIQHKALRYKLRMRNLKHPILPGKFRDFLLR